MKKSLSILLFVAAGLPIFSQTIEDYSNPQRYLFPPFNKDNVHLERPVGVLDNWGCYSCKQGPLFYNDGLIIPFDTLYYYLDDHYCMCSRHGASQSEPRSVYGVAIPVWDSVQHWNDTSAWILARDTLFLGYIATGTIVYGTHIVSAVQIYDTTHFRMGVNVWPDNWFKFKPANYSFDCHDSIYHVIEVYFDHPYLMTDSFWVGEYVYFRETFPYPPNYCCPRYGRMAIPDPSDNCSIYRISSYGWLAYDTSLYEPQWIITGGPRQHLQSENYMNYLWGMHFPIIAPPPCFVIPPLKIRNVRNTSVDIMWDNPVSSLYRRIELGPAGFTPGTGIVIDNFYGDSIHFQNLAPDLDYEVHVSSFCSTDSVYTEPTVAFFSTAMNCDMPQNLAVADITDSTAILFWRMTSLSDYSELEYGPQGFSHGEGRLLSPIYSLGTGNCSRMMDSLQPGTAYTAYVRTWCDYTEMFSDWERVDFTTTGVNPNDTASHDTTSIATAAQQRVTLVPNPATNSVTITAEAEILSVDAYNVKGQRIATSENHGTTLKLDTSSWPNGTYTIIIRTAKGSISKKLVIEKR